MADRDPLLQPAFGEGRLEFRAQLYRTPLLPFERQIIELIGCTEEEYRFLAAEAIRRGHVRPAGYEHIPEIRADVVSALISLAIGLAVSAVSYVLAPKPKPPQPGDNRSVTNQQLDSIAGGSRFSPTFGFDSQAELATYGEPIPVIFGRWTGTTGGMLVSPKLVWSRMFSYGTQQGAKLLLVVGEQGYDGGQTPQGIAIPNLEGVFLGNTPLNAIYNNQFAFYWRRNTTVSGTNRVTAEHLRYGTRGTAASGDPENSADVFACPTASSDADTGFSSAHQLSNNRDFGCFASIANGTGFRVNWRIASIPQQSGDTYENDPKGTLHAERVKIAGSAGYNPTTGFDDIFYRNNLRAAGMRGVGRNYSRRMGIIELNGQQVSLSEGTRVAVASVGSRIVFKISKARLVSTFYGTTGVTIDDINSAIDEERIAADDALQIGEVFMIGRTVWRVTTRSLAQWTPESTQHQLISLECIEVLGSGRIGLISSEALDRDIMWDETPNNLGAAGVNFFPLQRVSFALVRNTRPCEVTEIGIRSNVYQRLNGICNFQSLPTPGELIEAENSRVNLQSGNISSYVRRASAFTIYVRPAGFRPGTSTPYTWAPLGQDFVVVGNQSIDAYNFLRIRHPSRQRYEFRIVPKNGADIQYNDSTGTRYWLLNANAALAATANASPLSANYSTTYGTFGVSGTGVIVDRQAIRVNVELATGARLERLPLLSSVPERVSVYDRLPPDDGTTAIVVSATRSGWQTIPDIVYVEGRRDAFAWQNFGGADISTVPIGETTTREVRHVIGARWVRIRYTIRRIALVAQHWSGQSSTWEILQREIIASSNNWNGVTTFATLTTIASNNPFKAPPNVTAFSQVGDSYTGVVTQRVPAGRIQAFLEQVHGAARAQNFDFVATTRVTFTSGAKRIALDLRSTVVYVQGHWSGETKHWSDPVITVVTGPTLTSTNWLAGETFSITRVVSASNPFATPGISVGYVFGVDSVSTSTVGFTEQLAAERVFENNSQFADVSFYGGLIEKSNSSNAEHTVAYVNEIVSNPAAPTYDRMTICGLALKASRNFTTLDQLRVWLASGIPVLRFHPDDGGLLALNSLSRIGPSNLFCDLVYYLLTDPVAGLGKVLGITPTDPQIIDTDDLVSTARFLKANRLFFDGSIVTPSNLRQFIADTAPYFLCNFVISDGKFSLRPAVPTTAAGAISPDPVEIKQLFTSGNIIEDSFTLEYVPAEERKPFQAVVRYREETQNQLPQERNIVVRWASDDAFAPVESFDLTQFCTNVEHAELVGRFFLSIRRQVTHSIRFKTLPYGISIAPGDFIKVATEASPYSPSRNGTVGADGTIVSATDLPDGRYTVLYYKPGQDDVISATMTVSGGKVVETALSETIFTVVEATTSENVYMIEQITMEEDGTVQIAASEFPCDSRGSSLLAQDLLPQNRGRFVIDL